MALVIYDDACLEPSYLRLIASGGLAHAFAPRAFEITILGRLTCLPQVDTAADTLVVIQELFADQAGYILKTRRSLFDVLLPISRGIFRAAVFYVTTAVIMAISPFSLMAICAPRDTAAGPQDTTPPYLPCHEIRHCGSLSCLRSRRSFVETRNRQRPRARPRLVDETSACAA